MSCSINVDVNFEFSKWEKCLEDIENLIQESSELILNQTTITNYASTLELSILLCDDSFIQNLNQEYRSIEKPTNVLSFEVNDFEAGIYENVESDIILGDVIMAYETIEKESKEQNKPFKDHFIHLLTHGILHLIGYDHIDDNDALKMENLEINILKQLSIKNPY